VVVDGTWWQARKLLKRNATLAALPQIRFTPRAPSNYRIRREPADHCVATVEALAQVLGALEGDAERFAALLRPFNAMIDTQLHYARTVRGARSRHALHRARHPRRPRTPALLRERAQDVVCLHGEANAWPARAAAGHRAEIVHWLARRARTGETFEAIIAPRRPLAPLDPGHIRIAREQLAARRDVGRVPRALGGVGARRRRHLRVGALSAGPHGGGRRGAVRRARRHASGGGHVPGRTHGIARGLQRAPGRRAPRRIRRGAGRRAPGGAVGDSSTG
jgi:hypothetical protein